MVSGGGVGTFKISSSGSFVVYRADQEVDEKFELFATLYIPYDLFLALPIVNR
jgi:hypothetical protein